MRFVFSGRLIGPSAALFVLNLLAHNSAHASSERWSPEHDDAMRRAKVWVEPDTPMASAQLGANPDERFRRDQIVDCRFEPGKATGNTPQFDCVLPGDHTVKIKYGADSAEVFTEVLASRLLSALGFPTDRMYVVAAVRCAGCPVRPFQAMQCMGRKGATERGCLGRIDYSRARIFTDAVIESPIRGRRAEEGKRRGWSWEELEKVDPKAGGAPRPHADALRLMAVFLAHWDNKPEDQRLVCLGEDERDTRCARPLAMVQDIGATFGPNKANLQGWMAAPIWTNASACTVSMRGLPYGGSTFPDVRISEDGRAFLADRLGRLTPGQVSDLFAGARIERYRRREGATSTVRQWVDGFMSTVSQIVDRPPCPAA